MPTDRSGAAWPERAVASMAAAARRIPRAPRRILRRRLQAGQQRWLHARSLPRQRHDCAEQGREVRGAGAGCARLRQDQSAALAAPFRDTLDLRMAYGEFGGARNMVRVGRQELAFGEQRLIGHLNWVNTARSFDGVRATSRARRSSSTCSPPRSSRFSRTTSTRAATATVSTAPTGRSTTASSRRQTVEPYCLLAAVARADGRDRRHSATSIRRRSACAWPASFRATSTTASRWRCRRARSDRRRARVGRALAGRQDVRAARPAQPRPFVEFNYASGDANPNDGMRGTFDQLYPTGHDKFGLADQVGWRNIHHLRGGLELKPHGAVAADRQLSLVLARERDRRPLQRRAAPSSRDRPRARPAGTSARSSTCRPPTPTRRSSRSRGGYAHIFPGEFLKNTTPGAVLQPVRT